MEEPFIFRRDDVSLFGMLHKPAGSPRLGFVTCHPFAEEKLWSHRVFVSAARALAQAGHAVLRFDFSGAGDSGGSTAESISTRTARAASTPPTSSGPTRSFSWTGTTGWRCRR